MSRRRVLTAVSWVSVSAVLVTGAFWAGRAATEVPTIAAAPDVVETVAVQDGRLGRSVDVTVQARWSLSDVARAAAGGTVTTVSDLSGAPVEVGTILLTIDLHPVVLAQGAVPAFRDMAEGVVGQDVAQLQGFLRFSGFLAGEATGSYGASTTRAVTAWQKSLGLEQTGMVTQGALLFVETVPARLVLDPSVVVGAVVSPGAVLLKAVALAPEMWIESDSSQGSPYRADVAMVVESGDFSWDAVVSRVETDPETGAARLVLSSPDGAAVCGTQCGDAIPVLGRGGSTILAGRAVITPEVSGAMVPQSALGSTASGGNIVLDAQGRRIPIEVLVLADGQAIVTGVDAGETVRLHGSDE